MTDLYDRLRDFTRKKLNKNKKTNRKLKRKHVATKNKKKKK